MNKKNLYVFLLALALSTKVNFFGEFFIGEIFSIALIPFLILFEKLTKDELSIAMAAILWAIAQFVSDIKNLTPLDLSYKGVLSPVFFVSTFLVLVVYLKRNISHLPWILCGFYSSVFLMSLLNPNQVIRDNLWKWSIGPYVLALLYIYVSFFNLKFNKLIFIVCLALISLLSIKQGARGLAFFGIFPFVLYIFVIRQKNIHISKKNLFFYLAIAVSFLYCINFYLTDVIIFIGSSFLDPVLVDKFSSQSKGSLGLIFGGRTELFASFSAFMEQPIFGHGSWARDKMGFTLTMQDMLGNLGYDLGGMPVQGIDKDRLIPVHSYVMSGFVWAGLFGGMFWFLVLFNVLRSFTGKLFLLPPLFYYLTLLFVWNVFFSPFGSDHRFDTSVYLASFFAFVASSHDSRLIS